MYNNCYSLARVWAACGLRSHGYSASFSCLRLFPHWSKSKILFYACVEEGHSASLTIACEKQT